MQASLEQNGNRCRSTMVMIRTGIARDLNLSGIALWSNLLRDWTRYRMLVGHIVIKIKANRYLCRNRVDNQIGKSKTLSPSTYVGLGPTKSAPKVALPSVQDIETDDVLLNSDSAVR